MSDNSNYVYCAFIVAYALCGDCILVRRENAARLAYHNPIAGFRLPMPEELFCLSIWKPL